MPPDKGSDEGEPPLWKRLTWLAVIWCSSVAVLSVVAWIIRTWLKV